MFVFNRNLLAYTGNKYFQSDYNEDGAAKYLRFIRQPYAESLPDLQSAYTDYMITAATNAFRKSYPAMVNPADNASIEVAIPWMISAQKPTPLPSSSISLFCIPSHSIFPPINPRSRKAIHGINLSKILKYLAIV